MRRRAALTALSVALALGVAGCGGSSGTAAPGAASPAGAVSEEHGEADVAFVRDMAPHHEGAVAMAELAADRAGDPRVRALAERIAAAQGPELERLAELAEAWDVDLESSGHGTAHGGGHGSAHDGEQDVEALEPLSGAEFDREFLRRMIAHHESALPMARAELRDGEDVQARELAQQILDVQTAEIAEMERLLAG